MIISGPEECDQIIYRRFSQKNLQTFSKWPPLKRKSLLFKNISSFLLTRNILKDTFATIYNGNICYIITSI